MKKLLAILLLLVFVGCSESKPNIENDFEVSELNDTQRQLQMSEEYLLDLDEAIATLNEESLIGNFTLNHFKALGYTITVSDVIKVNDNYFDFTLNIKNENGDTIILPIKGVLQYSIFEDYGFVNFDAIWGSVFVNDEYLIITSLKQVFIFNSDDLSKTDIALDLSSLEAMGDDYVLYSAVQANNEFLLMYSNSKTNGHIKFSMSGQETSLKERENYYTAQEISNHTFRYLDYSGFILPFDDLSVVVYRTTDNVSQYIYLEKEDIVDMSWHNLNYEDEMNYFEIVGYQDTVIAYLRVNDETKALYIEHDMLHPDFFWYAMPGEEIDFARIYLSEDLKKVTLENDYFYSKLALDFENETIGVSYEFINESLVDEYGIIATHEATQTQLHAVSNSTWGDNSLSTIVLHNLLTKENTFLGIMGGMYGGGAQAGFFDNGDVYIFSPEYYKIFSRENNYSQTLDFKDTLNLGYYNDDENIKVIFSVLPKTDSDEYIVVYADFETSLFNEIEDSNFINSFYHIATVSKDGQMIDSYKTQQKVGITAFGYLSVETNFDENNPNILNIYGTVKGDDRQFVGEFDFTTNTYTVK